MVVFVSFDAGQAPATRLRPSRSLLEGLRALAAGRVIDEVVTATARRHGLADRRGRLTTAGHEVLNRYRGV